MSGVILACFLGALLFANVAQVVKHRHTVWEMRRRHLLSLHNVDMYQRALTTEPATASISKFINEEVNRA